MVSVRYIHTCLVHPSKGSASPASIIGTQVQLTGGMFDLLDGIYAKSGTECDVDIAFVPTADGKQTNACRDLILAYLAKPDLAKAQAIAARLAANTDGRSGLGLLFLIAGKVGREHKIVLSRFPTDSAIYVDENPGALTVEFLERVFMKNKTSYKAVVYQHASLRAGFWAGRAIDKQLNSLLGEPSNYWIADFLLSDFKTTPAAGTRRLAVAIRDAAKKASLPIKQELAAAGTLAAGLAGQHLSIAEFASRMGLSNDAAAAIVNELKSPKLAQERFRFDAGTYKSLVAYKAVELNNGAMLTADFEKFDDVFQQEAVDGAAGQVKFTTKGVIVDEKLKTAR